MDAIKFIKEKARMCDTYKGCIGCPIDEAKGDRLACGWWVNDHIEEAVAIVEKWSEEHPQKTLKDDFLEKYPKAEMYSTEEPYLCVMKLYGTDRCLASNCRECWNKPLSEVE